MKLSGEVHALPLMHSTHAGSVEQSATTLQHLDIMQLVQVDWAPKTLQLEVATQLCLRQSMD